jgi:hypothetical protein
MNCRPASVALVLVLSLSAAPRRLGVSNIAVPVPADPHELVTGEVRVPTAEERGPVVEILQRAMLNSRPPFAEMTPFRIDVSFTSSGEEGAGQGQYSMTWLSPTLWRWDVTWNGARFIRAATPEGSFTDGAVIPMRVQMARDAVFTPMFNIGIGAQFRMAQANLNDKPVTCTLSSLAVIGTAKYAGRLWEEAEYCVDNTTGLLSSASLAPGVFAVYGYSRAQNFHGHALPDHYIMYVAGKQLLDATVQYTDLPNASASAITPSRAEAPAKSAPVLGPPERQLIALPAPAGITTVTPVMVHANVIAGKVVNAEACAAANPSLVPEALRAVAHTPLPANGQEQVYFLVKFTPAAAN